MADYNVSDLARRFHVSNETIRQWTKEFGQFLSASARPAPGLHRRYEFADLEVLSLVADMRADHALFDEIHASLQAGERGVPAIDPVALIPLESQVQLQLLHDTISSLQSKVSDLDALLASERSRADHAQGERDALSKRLDMAQEDVIQLRIKIARLEAGRADNE